MAHCIPLPLSSVALSPDYSQSMDDRDEKRFAFLNFGNADLLGVPDEDMNSFWNTVSAPSGLALFRSALRRLLQNVIIDNIFSRALGFLSVRGRDILCSRERSLAWYVLLFS